MGSGCNCVWFVWWFGGFDAVYCWLVGGNLLSLLWLSLCLFGWGFWLVFWCVCDLVVCLMPSV